MNDLESLTVKQLQAELVKLGMPEEDVKAFKTKAPLISSIRTLEAKDAVKESGEEEVKRVKSIEEAPKPVEERQVNKNWKNKAEAMKNRLFKQPVVSILIPLEANEKAGVVVWAYTKDGAKMSDEEWNSLSIDQKMGTHQVAVSGAVESVQLNGYKYFIPKGRYTPVPQQIAEIISKSQQQTLDAGQDIRLDRIDPKTGRPFADTL